jgi:hypothetical protein
VARFDREAGVGFAQAPNFAAGIEQGALAMESAEGPDLAGQPAPYSTVYGSYWLIVIVPFALVLLQEADDTV